MRKDGRRVGQLRNMVFHLDWVDTPEGAALIEVGSTWILCRANLSEGAPRWCKSTGLGWVAAEYSMLPRAIATRSTRESIKGKLEGHIQETSYPVDRSLHAGVDCTALGEDAIEIDCSVSQADGGIYAAVIIGARIALHRTIEEGKTNGFIPGEPLEDSAYAISVGVIDGEARLGLPYGEGVRAKADINMVIAGIGELTEVQGATENKPFSHGDLSKLLDLAQENCVDLTRTQNAAMGAAKDTTLILIDGVLAWATMQTLPLKPQKR